MAEHKTGGRQKAADLQDNCSGTYDPVAPEKKPDTSQASPREQAQPGAAMQGEPARAEHSEQPEGLRRLPKGSYSTRTGRGEMPDQVPGPKTEFRAPNEASATDDFPTDGEMSKEHGDLRRQQEKAKGDRRG